MSAPYEPVQPARRKRDGKKRASGTRREQKKKKKKKEEKEEGGKNRERDRQEGRVRGRVILIITNYRDLWRAIFRITIPSADTRNRQEDGALSEDNNGRTVN